MTLAGLKHSQSGIKNVKSMAANSERMFQKAFLFDPDQIVFFFFCSIPFMRCMCQPIAFI